MRTLSHRARVSVLLLLSLACGAQRADAQGIARPEAARDSASIVRSDDARPRLTLLPVVGSAPETGFQYGATALRVYRLGDEATTRTSQQQLYAIYTTKSQARAWVQLDRWSAGDVWRVRARAEYQRFPLPFYGIGDATPKSAEEWYTSTGPTLQLLVQHKLRPALFVGSAARYTNVAVRDVEQGGALARGQAHGADGGAVVQLQAFVAHDSRDHILAPRRGHLVQFIATNAGNAIGSRYDFTRYAVDARRYWDLGRAHHVIAAQFLAEATTGRAPFDQLVQVGGDTAMRGYTRGRYRERDGLNAQVEYRSPFWHRLGVTAFGGGGMVMRRLTDVADATLLPTTGVGVRALLVPAQRATIRVDFGMGKGSNGLYVALNEAF